MQKSILYLTRDGFDLYINEKTNILHFDFSPSIVQDLEIINKEELDKNINTLIVSNKIPPSSLVVILSTNTLFQKNIPLQPKEQNNHEDEIQVFLSSVPFEHVASKVFHKDKSIDVIAANSNLFTSIKQSFEKLAFNVPTVIVSRSLGTDIVLKDRLSVEDARKLAHKIDSVKPRDNFFEQPAPEVLPKESFGTTAKSHEKKPASMLPVLVSVFVLLIGVLAILFIQQLNQKNTYIARSESLVTPIATAIPTVLPTPTVSTTSATLKFDTVRIQIVNGSKISGLAEKTKSQLVEIGFTNIQTGSASTLTATKTLVVFASAIPSAVRTKITEELQKNFTQVSTQETVKAQFDVIITLGQPLQ